MVIQLELYENRKRFSVEKLIKYLRYILRTYFYNYFIILVRIIKVHKH